MTEQRHYLLILLPTSTALLLSFTLGGRGLFMYPLLLIMGGLWLANIRPNTFRWIVGATAIFSLILLIIIGQARSSADFKNSSASNMIDRVTSVINSTKNINYEIENSSLRKFSVAM